VEQRTSQRSHAKTQRREGGIVLRALAAWREKVPSGLLVGVSGGADSVALLHALLALGYRPHVCHLNHCWRGAASDADAAFVRQLARQLGLPVTIQARKVAHSEDAARRARQIFFERVAKKTGSSTLVLAHTADDQAETFLLRLLRGAGPAGLGGMWADRRIGQLRVVRPLLEVTRSEIIKYLKSHHLTWREDASNADRRYLRNRIRHELLPLLERDYNPGIRKVLRRTAEILRAEAANDPVATRRRAIREWLDDLSFEHIEAVRQLATGGEVHLPGGVRVCSEYGRLRKTAGRGTPVAACWPLAENGETAISELCVRFHAKPGVAETCYNYNKFPRPAGKGECFDADALGAEPFVRTWREGDVFQPLGMTGTKKLQDFFVDEKVPRRQRGRLPLVCAADGRIAWVVGYRMADPFKVTEQTRRVLRLRAEPL